MRTNIDINEELMQQAMEVSQLKTKKAAVELALKEYVNMARRQDLASMFGQVAWEGDLNQMRADTAATE
jgi:Arc/MetJ family transcription regulator